jgi:ribosomal protein S18 acetylase RimI-like enzyme
MSLVSIRPFHDADVDGILGVWRAAGLIAPPNDPARDIRQARTRGAGDVFVAEFNGGLVATVMVGREDAQGWLYYLAVAPSVQRKGLGRAMVRYAEKWLQARGVAKVLLMIRDNPHNVREFYRRLGYQSEPKRIMSRTLPSMAGKPSAPAQQAAEAPR